MADPFLLRMSPEDAKAFLAACERAASGEQERRREAAQQQAATTRRQLAAAAPDPTCFAFTGAPPLEWDGPPIDDRLEYDRPLPPAPGTVDRRPPPGWRVVP